MNSVAGGTPIQSLEIQDYEQSKTNKQSNYYSGSKKLNLGNNDGLATRKIKGVTSIKGVLRESLTKNRNESFKELMQFNLDTEFAKAERNLTMVNATQQFVNKALRGNVQNKRAKKIKQFSQVDI